MKYSRLTFRSLGIPIATMLTEIVEYHFFSEPSGRTAAVEAHQNPDNNKSEIVIAVTISQVRKG